MGASSIEGKRSKRIQSKKNAVQIAQASAHEQHELIHGKSLVQEILYPKILYLDLVQMTAALLIPTFARMARDYHITSTNTTTNHSMEEDPEAGRFIHNKAQMEEAKSPEEDMKASKEPSSSTPDAADADADAAATVVVLPSKTPEKQAWDPSEELAPQPHDLLQVVLNTMWATLAAADISEHPSTTTTFAPKITANLIETLLRENGEMERASDPELIQRMMQVAGSSAPDADGEAAPESGYLDASALLSALTSDLQDWQVAIEDKESTYVHDIFGEEILTSFDRLGTGYHGFSPKNRKGFSFRNTLKGEETQRQQQQLKEHQPPHSPVVTDGSTPAPTDCPRTTEESHPSTKLATSDSAIEAVETMQNSPPDASNDGFSNDTPELEKPEDVVRLANRGANGATTIDGVVDQNASIITLLLAWLTFIGYTGTYAPLLLDLTPLQINCPDETFGCVLGSTIWKWYVAPPVHVQRLARYQN